MNLILEEDNISLLFVFNNIESYFDRKGNKTDYYVDLHGVYVEFK